MLDNDIYVPNFYGSSIVLFPCSSPLSRAMLENTQELSIILSLCANWGIDKIGLTVDHVVPNTIQRGRKKIITCRLD